MENINKIEKPTPKIIIGQKTKRSILLLFISAHLLIILTVCVYSSFDSYLSFYKEDQKDFVYPNALSNLKSILRIDGLTHYTVLAGIDAGYGFFAPNVASEYILEFSLKDKHHNILERNILPEFDSKESIQKYSTMLGTFQDKLKFFTDSSKTDPLYMRYLDVLIKSMAKGVIKKNANVDNVTATLYLYDYPSLSAYRNGNKKVQLIKILQFNVN
jgi:hypothetical protein